jgi:hypothetical protein
MVYGLSSRTHKGEHCVENYDSYPKRKTVSTESSIEAERRRREEKKKIETQHITLHYNIRRTFKWNAKKIYVAYVVRHKKFSSFHSSALALTHHKNI